MRPLPLALATALASACAVAPADDAGPTANDGMFRDFVDGKLDGAGHPLNARVIPAEQLCPGALADGRDCAGPLDGTAQRGELVVNVRVRVDAGGLAVRIVD